MMWFHLSVSFLKNINVKMMKTEIEITSWMIFNCHIVKGPPVTLLPNLLAGTINIYSRRAIPQLIKTAPIIPVFFNKAMSLNLKCPYQAMVIKVLEAIKRSMVYRGRMKDIKIRRFKDFKGRYIF